MTCPPEIINLLNDPFVHQISFRLAGQLIQGHDMSLVVAALQSSRWVVQVDPMLDVPEIDMDRQIIYLTYDFDGSADSTYSTLHECTHVMLILTCVDRPGNIVLVEVASTLLPVIYFFKAWTLDIHAGTLFARNPAAQAFVEAVRRHQLHRTCVELQYSDVQALYEQTNTALRAQRFGR
jgi:hypothetical protein